MIWRVDAASAVVAVAACLGPSEALSLTPAPVNARVEISAAVAGSSATLEAIERQAASRDRVRQQEIASLQARLVEAQTQSAAEVAVLQSQLTDAREALVADLSARDPAYAEVIALFRREVTDIASTPEGAAALAQFNRGEEVEALDVLDRLVAAEDRARQLAMESANRALQVQADRAAAASRRRPALLALDARNRSRLGTEAVIARYEEIVRLDPGESGDWYQLFLLYRAAGRGADALTAAERLEALAADDRELSTALVLAADILLSQGDRAGAMERYQRSLQISEQASSVDPVSAPFVRSVGMALNTVDSDLRQRIEQRFRPSRAAAVIDLPLWENRESADRARDMSVSLIRIGDVLSSQGDQDGAMAAYERALLIRRGLSADDRQSADRARDEAVSEAKIGDLMLGAGNFSSALSRYQRSLAIAERLSAAEPTSADRARDVSVWLLRIGDVFVNQRNHDAAMASFQRSLEIAERLSAADPASADLARDVSVSLNKIGDALLDQGDGAGALLRYQRALEINERLYVGNAASVDRARDLSVSLTKVGDVRLDQGDRDGALGWYQRSLEIVERLSSADPASADRARDVSVSLWKMAEATGERRYWERALAILRELESRGALRATDQPFVARLEEQLARPT